MAGRAWTTREIRYLLDNAGRVPEADICAELGRTSRAVESMAHRLRLQGVRLELRQYVPRVERCPECGGPMDALRGQGFAPGRPKPPRAAPSMCLACRHRLKAEGLRDEAARLLASAPYAVRASYESHGSRLLGANMAPPSPRPEAPRIPEGAPWPQRKRAEERHQIAVEEWAAEGQFRAMRAAQRRLERIRAAILRESASR